VVAGRHRIIRTSGTPQVFETFHIALLIIKGE
jgi:hypothetical protein